MKNDTKYTKGVNSLDLLAISFIVLKLAKIIDWSWWWVLSPILIMLGLTIIIAIGRIVLGVSEDE